MFLDHSNVVRICSTLPRLLISPSSKNLGIVPKPSPGASFVRRIWRPVEHVERHKRHKRHKDRAKLSSVDVPTIFLKQCI